MDNEVRHFKIGYIYEKSYHSVQVHIIPGQDILPKGVKQLIKKIHRELITEEDIERSDEEYEEIKKAKKAYAINLSNKYTVVSVTFLPLCEGCKYEAPGQKDHMEPPYGCLLFPPET